MVTRPPEDLKKNDGHIKREPQLRMVASSDSVIEQWRESRRPYRFMEYCMRIYC